MKACLPQLHTEPFVLQRDWDADGIPILSVSISLPRPTVTGSGVSRRIRRFYELQARSYLRYCERWLLPEAITEHHAALSSSSPLPHLHASLSYCVTYNENGFWSLYTQSCEPDTSGHPLFFRHGDTWDLASGYPVSLSSFFPSRSRWKTQLLKLAAQEIEHQESLGISSYHQEWRKELRRRFNQRNFYLTPEGLVFFFPMYSIAPAVERLPTFLVPYTVLRQSSFLPPI